MYSVAFVFLLIYLIQGFFIGLITSRNAEANIFRGRPAARGEVKCQVALEYDSTKLHKYNQSGLLATSFYCGGTVVSPYHVITAAHCLSDYATKEDMVLYFGIISLDKKSQEYYKSVRKASEVIVHPDYPEIERDIGIIVLTSNLVWNQYIEPIPLATEKPKYGDSCTISGWGMIDEQKTLTQNLMTGKTTITPCPLKEYEKYAICAGKPGAEPYYGDSGGPLICEGKLVGVVAGGDIGLSFYTDIASNLGWLQENGIDLYT